MKVDKTGTFERAMPKVIHFISASGGAMPTSPIIIQPRKRSKLEKAKDVVEIGAATAAGIGAVRATRTAQKLGEAAEEVKKVLRSGKGKKVIKKIISLASRLGVIVELDAPYLSDKQKRDRSLLHVTQVKKQIHNADLDRGEKNYVHSALAGALAGAVLGRHHKFPMKKAAGIGAAAGAVAEGLIRRSTEVTKDEYGERSRVAKKVEKLPVLAGLGVAALPLAHRLRKVSRAFESDVDLVEFGPVLDLLKNYATTGAKKVGQVLKKRPGLAAGLALTGGIAAADAATSAAQPDPDDDNDRAKAARKGLRRGLLYGGVLAASEPAITRGLKRVATSYSDDSDPITLEAAFDIIRLAALPIKYGGKIDYVAQQVAYDAQKLRRRKLRLPPHSARLARTVEGVDSSRRFKVLPPAPAVKAMSAAAALNLILFDRRRNYEHHSDYEAREKRGKRGAGQFVSGLRGYVEKRKNYAGEEVGITDQPVVRSAFRKAALANRIGTRGLRLHSDVVGALRGQQKLDARGRPLKREWERTWFRNTVVNAALAGGTLAGAALLRKNPKLRQEIGGALRGEGGLRTRTGRKVSGISRRIQSDTPDLFKRARRKTQGLFNIDKHLSKFERRSDGAILFFAPDWTVRDQRGHSARVYHSGSQEPRQRRQAYWYEKKSGHRLISAVVGALAGGALGASAVLTHGHLKKIARAQRIRPKPTNIRAHNFRPEPVVA